jgi:FkbM family methyltransferase
MTSLVQAARSAVRLSGLVQERPRFVARQAARRPVVARYRLRENGVAFHLRHATPDLNTLEQVVGQGHYALPSAVEAPLRALGRPLEIVDLGANIGLFGAWVLSRWPAARIVAYEPDPANAAMHRDLVAAGGRAHRWRLVEAAAGARAGEAWFQPGLESASHVVEAGADGAIRVPVVDAVAECAGADLVKIDIEGGEWEVLADPRLSSARAVVVEHHPEGAPGDDPRASAERLLRERGFDVVGVPGEQDGIGMLWGVPA